MDWILNRWRWAAVAALVSAGAAAVALVVVLLTAPPRTTSHRESAGPKTAAAKMPGPKDAERLTKPTVVHYYRVHVALDGALTAGKETFRLYAADVLGREHTCTYENGQRWACGLRSYVALVNLIGSALIECHPKDLLKPDRMICRVGDIDIAEWMLRNGWAHLEKGVTEESYVEAAKSASSEKAGMWTPAPPQAATAQ